MSLTKSGIQNSPPVSLDALRSPQIKSFDSAESTTLPGKSPERDSIASVSSFNDIALDDDVLDDSPVLVTARPLKPGLKPDALDNDSDEKPIPPEDTEPVVLLGARRFSTSSSFPISSDDPPFRSHKKTTSTTTIRSSHRLSLESNPAARRESARASIEGHHKLQEEFARLQKEEQTQATINGDGSIDWGKCVRLSNRL